MSQKRLLLIAFHYPPIQGSSGVQRSLAFSKYLTQFGWDVSVLTVHERAHERVLAANLDTIPDYVEVIRAQAWDAARHFSIAGRYPSTFALPDRWSSWVPFGARTGAKLLQSGRFSAVMSTFPIGSAHLIGRALHRRSGIPWIADFRDPMVTDGYPLEARLRGLWRRIQDSVIRESTCVTVTTPGAAGFYRELYPMVPRDHFAVIENGFDPEMFDELAESTPKPVAPDAPLLLLHSGVLYREDRHPEPFFRALRRLLDSGAIGPDSVRVRLRASGFEDEYRGILETLGLTAMVSLVPPIPYVEALREMGEASALLLFQGTAFKTQVPAKAYEYLYARRPILGFTDPDGDTGRLLGRFGVPGVAKLEDESALAEMLAKAFASIRRGDYPIPPRESVMSVSRRAGAEALARLLDRATGVR